MGMELSEAATDRLLLSRGHDLCAPWTIHRSAVDMNMDNIHSGIWVEQSESIERLPLAVFLDWSRCCHGSGEKHACGQTPVSKGTWR